MENRADSIIIKQPFPSESFSEKLGMRLYQNLTFSNYNGLLNMVNIKQISKRFVKQNTNNLRPLFDCIRLENELDVLYRSNDFVRKHAHELITFIKSVNPNLEVYKLRQLICTIPSNTASAKRKFSALKRISSCFRCSQHQERVSGLSEAKTISLLLCCFCFFKSIFLAAKVLTEYKR